METKTINVMTIDMVKGSTVKNYWKSPAYIINDYYIMSSITDHNINKRSINDLPLGTVEVYTQEQDGITWIAPV